MTGDSIDAAKAEAAGLVNHVYPADEFAKRVKAYAATLAQGATAAMGLAKQAIYYGLNHGLADTLAEEGRLQAAAGATADHQEGVMAFVEKRPPVFRGR
jgi:2-(1,2-epoxy-1,2-dihydrophenyl)acetyl-CoA isomerase